MKDLRFLTKNAIVVLLSFLLGHIRGCMPTFFAFLVEFLKVYSKTSGFSSRFLNGILKLLRAKNSIALNYIKKY